eukprot:TRINITY_DN11429_c0_g2_i3.p1 TRINITY_DN11429_c0_g2~~TRINITY_DN11429_c0_g2_i3.p1  ORF type:complete len:180 (-),score=30.80 TRINITY_DN11429_c0_g2_i3:91-630(-)
MNDLDLHCHCFCGNHIYYGQKVCNTCKGFLDVDMNVTPTTNTPVEHIYWARVPRGQFQITVEFFRHHENVPLVTEYLVLIKIHDEFVFEKAGVLDTAKASHHLLTFSFDEDGNFSSIPQDQFKPRVQHQFSMPRSIHHRAFMTYGMPRAQVYGYRQYGEEELEQDLELEQEPKQEQEQK